MLSRKFTVIGDGASGKSSMLITLCTGSFPGDYIPTVFDNYSFNTMHNSVAYSVGFWDTAGQEDYDRLRPLSYPSTDLFLICFNVSNPTSLENIEAKWIQEIQHFCPGVPIVIMGTMIDLRENEATLRRLADRGSRVVSKEEGEEFARKHKLKYKEISSLTGQGLSGLIPYFIDCSNEYASPAKKSKGSIFNIGSNLNLFGKKSSSHQQQNQQQQQQVENLPPVLPPQKKAPYIYIQNAQINTDFLKLLNNPYGSDVIFSQGNGENKRILYAHRLMLCLSSSLFRKIFSVRYENESVSEDQKDLIFQSIIKKEDESSYHIILKDTISFKLFVKVMEFLYAGIIELKSRDPLASGIKDLAEIMLCPELVTMCENSINSVESFEIFNISIGTWLNDRNAEVTKRLFLDRYLFSDCKIRVSKTLRDGGEDREENLEDNGGLISQNQSQNQNQNHEVEEEEEEEEKVFYAHKALLFARCPVLATMLTSGFAEGIGNNEIKIDAKPSTFAAFLEFLYTDHSTLEGSDEFDILKFSDQYGVSRLITLCELQITKRIDRAVAKGIAKADISVIDILNFAQTHNATQLTEFCLHFISSNYQSMKKRSDFGKIQEENMKYIEENQWPPKSYLELLEAYEKNNTDSCSIM